MGKRQHQKDKMYITYTEWTTLYGGKRSGTSKEEDTSFKRLPYDHCSLCLQPFDEPYCDLDGNVFELVAIADFVKKFKVNPVTGKKFDVKSLIKLKFHNNSEGNHHCPVLFKPFTKNSHIVAIRTSGNVYSYEAVDELNVKGKNWKDLIDDTSFVKSDIITIQDPNNLGKFNISTFHHVKNNLRVETEEEIAMKKDPHARLKSVSAETREILKQLEKDYKSPDKEEVKKEVADKFNAAHYSTGMVAASFTSTAMAPEMVHEAAIIHEDDVIYDRVKKKGYVRIMTNYGPLNFELYCDVTPKACHNFIKHCNNGYYNGTKFHRSIRNFMIQGGDPTGTGLGGESVWKKPFEDEIRPNLHHTGRGILSMANSGPNTNGSQFFITFRSCKQLDGKHTIFGKLVGGLDTLNLIEQVEVDNKDRPVHDIVLEVAQVFVDPFAEAEELVVKLRQDARQDSLADDPNRSHRAGALSPSRRDRDRREPTSPFRQRPQSSSWQSKPPHHTLRRSRSPEQKRWHPKATSFKRHPKSPPHRVWRSRSPHFRVKRSRSPLPRVHRSRSPRSKPTRSRSPHLRVKRSRLPLPRVHRSRSPRSKPTRSRSPHLRVKRSRSPLPRVHRSRSPRSKPTRSRSPFLPRSRSPRPRVKRSCSPDFKDSQQRTVKRARPSQSYYNENVNVPKNRSCSPQYLQPKSSSRDTSVKETLPSALPVILVEPLSKENATESQSKKNYADKLQEMLNIKMARGEQLHLYYYSKMFLLNVCEIKGRHAVDCLTAGIEDSEFRSEVERNEFTEPEQVLTYFKDVQSQSKQVIDAICDKNADQPGNNVKCCNCHGVGHPASLCPAPQLKCINCKFQGHTVENCPIATNTSQSIENNINRACSNCNEGGHTVSECLKLVNYQTVVNNYKFTGFQQKTHYSDYADCQNSVNEYANSFSTSDGFVTDNFQNTQDVTVGHNIIVNCNKKSKYCFQCQSLHPKGKCPKQKTCFRCNKAGHLRNDCIIKKYFKTIEVCESNVLTLKDGTSKNRSCLICGKLGHLSSQCRNAKLLDFTAPNKIITENVQAFRKIICKSCKEPGHMSNECPQPKINCTNCKKRGHLVSDCINPIITRSDVDSENAENVSGVKASKISCFNCKELGHKSYNCPQPKVNCTNCKKMGHLVSDCRIPEISPVGDPENVVEQMITENVSGVKASKMFCFNCKERGHKFNNCPQPKLMCTNCKKKGHLVSDCKKPKTISVGDSETVVKQIITENVGDVEASSSNKIEENNTTSIDNMKDSVC